MAVRGLLIVVAMGVLAACAGQTVPHTSVTDTASCAVQVHDLQKVSVQPADPTDGFRRNQLCIAERACANRAKFEQPQWLDQVMQRFIDPYTRQEHAWKQVVTHCQQRSRLNPLRALMCQREMAQYHIFTDLNKALAQTGCSSAADWQRLESYIVGCVQDAHYPPLISTYIQNRLVSYRNQVRQQCLGIP